ncbi:alpha/beta fold hydrolase [Microbulbifer sp. OS29]|uniref:Alpha/beta fold hydrolase n=1 Tax=Microbulbifer okhotskensis TaxID=2926617 RepID=A0A9X2J522_9GAMM|nr:alpha/beta fold hydrolase [Microbulbifer okhotskensis]MCO1334753.1 alpha/beta fold hydrolase [Microbulbifer okhotskensis]
MTQEFFQARDNSNLSFRWLPADNTEFTLICLHGSTFSSQWYLMFGRIVHSHGISVCLPDWRGHGKSEGKPGDLDYSDQLQDDLSDLIKHLNKRGVNHFVLGGHSAGSLVALKYIHLYGTDSIAGFFAIAPPLTQSEETRKYDIPVSGLEYFVRYNRKRHYTRPVAGKDQQNLPKLSLWKYWVALIFPRLRKLSVLRFPPVGSVAGNQGRVLDCTFNLLSAYSVKRYSDLFASLDIPCHFLVGEKDEVIDTHVLHTIMSWYVSPSIESKLTELPRATHMSAISASAKPISGWLESLLALPVGVES